VILGVDIRMEELHHHASLKRNSFKCNVSLKISALNLGFFSEWY
jgi:hypothetical protein